jgi:hypothetical protein
MNVDQIEIELLFESTPFSAFNNLESPNCFKNNIAASFNNILLSNLLIIAKHNIALMQDIKIISLGTANNGIRQYS